MKRKKSIRLLSVFMLLVFAFSITPRLVLHNVFAGHIDNIPSKNSKFPLQVNSTGFNCDKDGVVSTAPFVADEPVRYFHPLNYFSPYASGQVALSAAIPIYDPLRGPPIADM